MKKIYSYNEVNLNDLVMCIYDNNSYDVIKINDIDFKDSEQLIIDFNFIINLNIKRSNVGEWCISDINYIKKYKERVYIKFFR